MRSTFVEELKRSDIGVLATSRGDIGVDVWFRALGLAKPRILRDFKKLERPYFSVLQLSGQITTRIISADHTTRRDRPREREMTEAV